jgi:hypothetical protein
MHYRVSSAREDAAIAGFGVRPFLTQPHLGQMPQHSRATNDVWSGEHDALFRRTTDERSRTPRYIVARIGADHLSDTSQL